MSRPGIFPALPPRKALTIMADATVRITGTVLHVDTRSGISRPRGDEPGRPYVINTARVLVESTGIADVTLPDTVHVIKGEDVDFLADVSVYGGRAQLRALATA
jgi:hypothetical protein